MVYLAFSEDVIDSDLDTAGCAHWWFFFEHWEVVGDLRVSDSESSYYNFKFSMNFDRKFPIYGVMFDMI
jgi:hypothetical protein